MAADGKSIEPGLVFSTVNMTCEKGTTSESNFDFHHPMPVTGASFKFHNDEGGYVFDVKGEFGPRAPPRAP